MSSVLELQILACQYLSWVERLADKFPATLYTTETFSFMEHSVELFTGAAFDPQKLVVDSLEDQRDFLKTEFDNFRKMIELHTHSTTANLVNSHLLASPTL